MAKESPQPGCLLLSDNLPITIEDIADEAAVSVEDVKKALDKFMFQSMLTYNNNVYVVIHWEERQFESDNSTSRTRKFRSNKNAGTLQERCGNVAGTPPDTDTDTDTESDTDTDTDIEDEDDAHAATHEDKIPPDAVPNESLESVTDKSAFEITEYFNQKSGVFSLDGIDIALAIELVKDIPISVIKQGIDEAFRKYKPKHTGEKIRTLRYCKGPILDAWDIDQAKDGKIQSGIDISKSTNHSKWTKSSKNTQSQRPGGRSNNYDQREYTQNQIKELEKTLLGQDDPEDEDGG
jgi:hypothetical protein